MKDDFPEVRIGASTLLAVPAVHYRAVFAERVNHACAHESTRPDAIAVELGPSAVSTVSTWLRELGVRPRHKTILPCMLGAIRANQRIRADLREKAIRLQETTGRQLHELPPALLRKALGYSSASLLCLSPTDSIIEAIRCALELEAPVYGVDLEDYARTDRCNVLIQDPIEAQSGLADYVRKNAKFSESYRDQIVDERREAVMAARLKTLLARHRRVLFTGGLAHWQRIQTFLQDRSLQPATAVPAGGSVPYTRVVVHPALAAHQMDIFPNVTHWYEKRREPVPRENAVRDIVDFNVFFHEHLSATYANYFHTADSGHQVDRKLEDYQGLEGFEHFLVALCAIRQQLVPDIFTALEAAEAMMSPRFCEALADTLMSYGPGWAGPQEWPELSIIGPSPLDASEEPWLGIGKKAEMLIPIPGAQPGSGGDRYRRSQPFYISCTPGTDGRFVHVKNPWMWGNEPMMHQIRNSGEYYRVWPPCDNLLFGTSFQAAEVACNSRRDRRVDYFEGSLYDGIDIKATLRSAARGENRVYIRENSLASLTASSDVTNPDPTVFIFTTSPARPGAEWQCLFAGFGEIGRYVRNFERFREVFNQRGGAFVSSVNYFVRESPAKHLAEFVLDIRVLEGSIVFGNPCLTSVQAARWLESAKYNCCPCYAGGDIERLVEMYKERHKISIDLRDWTSALVQFAVPYAKHRIVVVVPDHFVVGANASRDARTYGLQLDVLPLSYFSAWDIRKMRKQYLVEALDADGRNYPSELERLLGESKDAHFMMLPQRVREQLTLEG